MSPVARSSQESASNAVLAKPSLPMLEALQEAVLSKVSLADENIALKQRIATLEMAEKRLSERVTNAEKLAIAAKFDTNAATARAQKRYTEMLHANNETRHVRLALEKEKTERADYLAGSKGVFQGMKDEISRLNTDKANGIWAKELTEQMDVLQDGFLAGEEDKKALNKIIGDLNKTISRLKGEKEVSDKMLKDSESLVAILRQGLDAEKSKSKAAPDTPTKNQIEALIATTRDEATKEATGTARGTFDTMTANLTEQFKMAVKTMRMQMKAQAEHLFKTNTDKWRLMEQTYKRNVAALELELSAATTQIELHRQRLATAPGAVQRSHQRPAKHGQEILPQEAFNPNKRRRLDSFGAAGITTPEFQHTRSAPLSDTNIMSPRSTANTNGHAMMGGAHVQGQSSQHSNSSAGQMTPTQRLSQQQNGNPYPQQLPNMMSPHQRQLFQQQMASNDASRQSPASGSYSPHPTYNSPQPPQRTGNGQKPTNQPRSLRLFKTHDFETNQAQQTTQPVRPQTQAQSQIPTQQQMQFTRPYGSAFMMQPTQPYAMQAPSKRSMSFGTQPQSMNHEADRRYAPTIRGTETMTTFNGESTFMGETYAGDDCYSTEGEPAKQGSTPRAFTPTLPSNSMPQMQKFDYQQPQQRVFQYHTVDPSQIQIGNSMDTSCYPNSAHDEPNMYVSNSRQPSVPGRATRASSCSTPAPARRSRGQNLGPAETVKVPCVNCYQHWWEHDCDEREPCSNCAAEGIECMRQKCFNFAAGTCDKGNRCPNVHEGDERYQDDSHLVGQAKANKRLQRLGKKADAAQPPITIQQDYEAMEPFVAENWSYEAEMKVLDDMVEEMDKENEHLKYEAVDNPIDQGYIAALESQKASLEFKNAALRRREARWRKLARSYALTGVFANEDFEDVGVEMNNLDLSGETGSDRAPK
ncbi:hypothetical protein G6011_03639 [Alternaria panax]|uniref:C3H1-type domain-containing protein n=1 Tax=Alternaria panax TaxID=48097 RepID=A0AAD4IFL3_9PLEO|nr:hypothetical protein G6011_03639 [Alternaria panax]